MTIADYFHIGVPAFFVFVGFFATKYPDVGAQVKGLRTGLVFLWGVLAFCVFKLIQSFSIEPMALVRGTTKYGEKYYYHNFSGSIFYLLSIIAIFLLIRGVRRQIKARKKLIFIKED